ncbi:hypothetical protein ACNKHV_07875 [Shigella flexneri]
MACVADKILSAPCTPVGSMGWWHKCPTLTAS